MSKPVVQNRDTESTLSPHTTVPDKSSNHCSEPLRPIQDQEWKQEEERKENKRQTAKKARKTKARAKDMRASQLQIIDTHLGVSYHFKRRLLPAVSRLISACREHVHHSKRQSRSLEVVHYKTKAY